MSGKIERVIFEKKENSKHKGNISLLI